MFGIVQVQKIVDDITRQLGTVQISGTLPLPTGAATAANQVLEIAELTTLNGKVATAANQATGNASLSSIDGKITACDTTGKATASNQTDGSQKSQQVDGSGNVQPAGDDPDRQVWTTDALNYNAAEAERFAHGTVTADWTGDSSSNATNSSGNKRVVTSIHLDGLNDPTAQVLLSIIIPVRVQVKIDGTTEFEKIMAFGADSSGLDLLINWPNGSNLNTTVYLGGSTDLNIKITCMYREIA